MKKIRILTVNLLIIVASCGVCVFGKDDKATNPPSEQSKSTTIKEDKGSKNTDADNSQVQSLGNSSVDKTKTGDVQNQSQSKTNGNSSNTNNTNNGAEGVSNGIESEVSNIDENESHQYDNLQGVDSHENSKYNSLENYSNTNKKFSSLWHYMLLALIILLCLVIGFLYLEIKKIKKSLNDDLWRDKIKEIITGSKNLKPSETIKNYFINLIPKPNTVNNSGYKPSQCDTDLIIDNVIVQLKKFNPQLFIDITSQERTILNPKVVDVKVVENPRQPKINIKNLYCEEARNGSYFDINISNEKQVGSIFYLNLQNDSTVKFGLIQDEKVMRKVFEFDDYLRNSCDVGALITNAKGLSLIDEGIADKDGEKWVIRRKAKYKYI